MGNKYVKLHWVTSDGNPQAWSFNAFVAGPPVLHDEFFGRGSEVAQLIARLRHRQSVLVTGERRIGKTSLLSESHRRLSAAATLKEHFLYLDAQEFSSVASLLAAVRKFVGGILPPSSKDKRHQTDLNSLIPALEDAERDGQRITLFINDLDDILDTGSSSSGESRMDSLLRALVERRRLTICASSFGKMLVAPDSSSKAPLFNVFFPLALRCFKEPEAVDLLKVNSRNSGEELSGQEQRFVLDLAGRKPFQIQEFGFRLFTEPEFRGSQDPHRRTSFEAAAEGFADAMQHHWFYSWSALTIAQQTALVKALKGEVPKDQASYSYLAERGLVGVDDVGPSSMGSLFASFVGHLSPLTENDSSPRARAIGGVKGFLDVAIKAAVDAAVRAFLSGGN